MPANEPSLLDIVDALDDEVVRKVFGPDSALSRSNLMQVTQMGKERIPAEENALVVLD